MGVNSLPKTVTRQRRDCDFNPGPTAPESSTLTTRLPSHPSLSYLLTNLAGRRLAYRRTLHYQFIIVSRRVAWRGNRRLHAHTRTFNCQISRPASGKRPAARIQKIGRWP